MDVASAHSSGDSDPIIGPLINNICQDGRYRELMVLALRQHYPHLKLEPDETEAIAERVKAIAPHFGYLEDLWTASVGIRAANLHEFRHDLIALRVKQLLKLHVPRLSLAPFSAEHQAGQGEEGSSLLSEADELVRLLLESRGNGEHLFGTGQTSTRLPGAIPTIPTWGAWASSLFVDSSPSSLSQQRSDQTRINDVLMKEFVGRWHEYRPETVALLLAEIELMTHRAQLDVRTRQGMAILTPNHTATPYPTEVCLVVPALPVLDMSHDPVASSSPSDSTTWVAGAGAQPALQALRASYSRWHSPDWTSAPPTIGSIIGVIAMHNCKMLNGERRGSCQQEEREKDAVMEDMSRSNGGPPENTRLSSSWAEAVAYIAYAIRPRIREIQLYVTLPAGIKVSDCYAAFNDEVPPKLLELLSATGLAGPSFNPDIRLWDVSVHNVPALFGLVDDNRSFTVSGPFAVLAAHALQARFVDGVDNSLALGVFDRYQAVQPDSLMIDIKREHVGWLLAEARATRNLQKAVSTGGIWAAMLGMGLPGIASE